MVLLQDGTEYTPQASAQSKAEPASPSSYSVLPTQVLDAQNAQDILQRSLEFPLLCVGHVEDRALIDTCETFLQGFRDRVLLVTLDINDHPMLAQQLGFMSSGSKIIIQGQIMAELSGQEPIEQVRSLFERIVGPAVDEPTTDTSTGKVDEAQWSAKIDQLRAQQAWSDAEIAIQEALAYFPENMHFATQSGHLLLDQLKVPEARTLLNALAFSGPEYDQLAARVRFYEWAVHQKTEPDEWVEDFSALGAEALWVQAFWACHFGRYLDSFERLVALHQRFPDFEQPAAKEALPVLLNIMGFEHPDVKHLRRRLFSILH